MQSHAPPNNNRSAAPSAYGSPSFPSNHTQRGGYDSGTSHFPVSGSNMVAPNSSGAAPTTAYGPGPQPYGSMTHPQSNHSYGVGTNASPAAGAGRIGGNPYAHEDVKSRMGQHTAGGANPQSDPFRRDFSHAPTESTLSMKMPDMAAASGMPRASTAASAFAPHSMHANTHNGAYEKTATPPMHNQFQAPRMGSGTNGPPYSGAFPHPPFQSPATAAATATAAAQPAPMHGVPLPAAQSAFTSPMYGAQQPYGVARGPPPPPPPPPSWYSQAFADPKRVLMYAAAGGVACAAYAMFNNLTEKRNLLYVLPKKVEAMHVDFDMSGYLNQLAAFRPFHPPAYDKALVSIDRLFQHEDAISNYGPNDGDPSVMKMYLETIDTALVELRLAIRNPNKQFDCSLIIEDIQRQLGRHNQNILLMTAPLRDQTPRGE